MSQQIGLVSGVRSALIGVLGLLLPSCTTIPNGVQPVDGFLIDRYLGTWYEIARLDHSFERGLERVQAQYSQTPEGYIEVVNRGLDIEKSQWREAFGKAYFVGDETVGHLKVSFFGPFYGSYIVFELDQEAYQYALVCGPNHSYLWLLARDTALPEETLQRLVDRARASGFPTHELIYVNHTASGAEKN